MADTLQDYIQQARQSGMSDDVIRQELQKAGWNNDAINSHLGTNSNFHFSLPQGPKKLVVIMLALLLLAGIFVALSISAGSVSSFYKPVACVMSGGSWSSKNPNVERDGWTTLEERTPRCYCPENSYYDDPFCSSYNAGSLFGSDDEEVTIEGYTNTYTHPTKGFSFMYPDWVIVGEGSAGIYGTTVSIDGVEKIGVRVTDLGKVGDLGLVDCESSDYVECLVERFQETYESEEIQIEATVIGGRKAGVISFYDNGRLRSKIIYPDMYSQGKLVYVAAVEADLQSELSNDTIELAENIVATFKILPSQESSLPTKQPTTATPEMRTETLDLYGLSLTVPESWNVEEVNRRPEPEDAPSKRGHDCADYEITGADNDFEVTLSFPCGYTDAGALDLPDNVTIVLQSGDKGYARIPYGPQFSYVRYISTTVTDSKGERTLRQYSNILSFKSTKHDDLVGYISGRYSGPESEKAAFFGRLDAIALELLEWI